MAKQIFGRQFNKMPDSYQARMKANYGDQAEAEHKARGEAQTRFRDGEMVNYKVEDGNFDQFVTSGNSRMSGAGGAASGVGDKVGEARNKVSALDFKRLYQENLAKDAKKADKIETKRALVDFGRGLTRGFEKDDVSSVQAAGYGDAAERRLSKYASQVAAYDEKQKRKETAKAPVDTKPPQVVAPRPGGGNNSPTQGINVGDIATGEAKVKGKNNAVNTGIQGSFNQSSTIDNSRVYEGDDRNFTKIVANSNNDSRENNNYDYRDNSSTDKSTNIYAPQASYKAKADYSGDYSDATMAGFYKPSDSPAATQKFLATYMDGMKGSADEYSDALYNLKRNYADNLAMVDYETAQARMDQLTGKYEDKAELNRLESQPSALTGFKGIQMYDLPNKVEDETKKIYESFA